MVGVLFLQVCAISEEDVANVFRRVGAVDLAREAVASEPRQMAGAVQVLVRQNHSRDGLGWHRKGDEFLQPKLLQPVKQPAIHEHASSTV